MAVKVQPGSTVVETKQTTVVPSNEARRLSDGTPLVSQSEFWDWMESTPPETLAKYETVINLYRIDGTKRSLCEQIYYPPDAVRFSRGWIKKFYGGGVYNILVRIEKQLRFNIELPIEGMPKTAEEIEIAKNPNAGGNGASPSYSGAGSETTIVLRELVGMLRDELRAARGGGASETAVNNAVALSGQVFSSAVGAATETLRQVNGAGSAAPNPMDDLTKQFMAAAIGKLLNPSDPIETFGKMMLAMKAMNDQSGGGGPQQETLTQTLVRVLPQVLDKVQGGMANMATLRQQELEIMRMRGGAPPNAITVRPSAAQPNPLPAAAADGAATSPQPPPTPASQAGGPPPGMGMQDFIELGIARIANNPNLTAEGAAMEMLVLLDAYVPELVDGTCNDPEAESNLLKMFRERPILQQVPQNPRLTELIKNFLEKARESRSQMQPPEGAQPGGIPPAAGGEPPQPSA